MRKKIIGGVLHTFVLPGREFIPPQGIIQRIKKYFRKVLKLWGIM